MGRRRERAMSRHRCVPSQASKYVQRGRKSMLLPMFFAGAGGAGGERMADWAMAPEFAPAMGLGASVASLHAADGSREQCAATPAAAASGRAGIAAPRAGISKPGFIDHSDGANFRTSPAEVVMRSA